MDPQKRMVKFSCFQVPLGERCREHNLSSRRPSFPMPALASAMYDTAQQMILNGSFAVEMTLLLLQGVCVSVLVCECCLGLRSPEIT